LNVLLLLADLDSFLARKHTGCYCLIIVSGLLVWQVLKTWRLWQKIENQAFIIAGIVCIAGAAIVIAAAYKYQWASLFSERHALPYLFSLLIVLALILKNNNVKISQRWRWRWLGLGIGLL